MVNLTPKTNGRTTTRPGSPPHTSHESSERLRHWVIARYRPTSTSVQPTAATKSPLSGRNIVARPPENPARTHHLALFARVLAFIARVAANAQSVANKVVHVSVSMVVT